MARVEYDAPCSKVEHLTLNNDGSRPISLYTQAPKYDVETFLLDRMQESTYIITQRIWSEDVQNKYIRKAADIPTGMLQKSVIRALFGVTRKERVAVYELQLPLDLRILLLNECIKICKVAKITPTNNQSSKITEAVAIRAYKRIVSDKKGATREDIDLFKETMDFPSALANEIQKNGYIDEWAERVNFDHTEITPHLAKEKKKTKKDDSSGCITAPKVKQYFFNRGHSTQKFWFMTIDNAFSKDFWDTWITALDEMRFCVGLGGKSDAYVRCSSSEKGAIFTTSGRYMYHTLPLHEMEARIIRLAKFVMSFQKSFVHRFYGGDYKVTWDANILHHVVGPIANAVYGYHSDCSPLLNSTSAQFTKMCIYQHEEKCRSLRFITRTTKMGMASPLVQRLRINAKIRSSVWHQLDQGVFTSKDLDLRQLE
jgi:hypothetical protein